MPSTASPRSLRRQKAVVLGIAIVLAGAGIGVPLAHYLTRPTLVAPVRVATYQVTYRVTTATGPGASSTYWERLTVQRPFDSSDVAYRTEPGPAAVPLSGSLFTKDVLYTVQGAAVRPVAGRQPGPGGDDQDLATQMPELEARGLARDLGRTRTLAGRLCRVFRLSGPPNGAIAPFQGSDHDDICIDSAGIELGEDWTYRGRLVEDRRAVAVETGPVRSPVSASGRPTLAPGLPYTAPDAGATTFVPTPVAPAGFRQTDVDRFIEPDPQNPPALLASSVVWAFVRGADVITVEAGQGPAGEPPWTQEPTRTRQVTLTSLGEAETAIRSDGAEIRIDLGNGDWVRVRGTVPVAGLIAYADGLRSRS